jgi:predicted metal-dependent hydrolase
MNKITWPPQYTLRRNPRTKRISFKVSLRHGLEIVIPQRCALRHVDLALEEARDFIEKQLARVHTKREQANATPLPDKLIFPATLETWPITYRQTDAPPRLTRRQQQLTLTGDCHALARVQSSLRTWIKKHAKKRLNPWLRALSEQHNLPINRITIRDQHTRWGSCSEEKNINLNYKLLFLPQPLATHILLHELCHTRHLNHSQSFWNLLETLDPNFQANKQQAKKASDHVPLWLELKSD